MWLSKFQLYKVEKNIQYQGMVVTFLKDRKDLFGETNPDLPPTEIRVRGLFHEQTSYLSGTTSDSSSVHRKTLPMLLCLYREAGDLTTEYYCTINQKTYKVKAVDNLQEANVLCEVSLEEVQGNK